MMRTKRILCKKKKIKALYVNVSHTAAVLPKKSFCLRVQVSRTENIYCCYNNGTVTRAATTTVLGTKIEI